MQASPLLELPDAVLEAVLLQLPTARERARAAVLCKRLRRLCWESRMLWSHLDETFGPEQLPCLSCFSRWLSKADRGVCSLHLRISTAPDSDAMAPVRVEGSLMSITSAVRYTVRQLALDLTGGLLYAAIDWFVSLQWHVEKLWISASTIIVPDSLSKMTHLRKLALHGKLRYLSSRLSRATATKSWVPSQLEKLGLGFHGAPDPGFLASIGAATWLQALALHGDGLSGQALDFLGGLSSLKELHLTSCQLASLPSQLSALHRLRVLYLAGNPQLGAMASRAWSPLQHLPQLAFLSLSNCALQELPPAIAGIASLQALYLEGNRIGHLPHGPYLAQLKELCLDWQLMFSSHAVLAQHATCLSRLLVAGKHSFGPGASSAAGREQRVGQLLASLAALPMLSEFVDVVGQPEGEGGGQTMEGGVVLVADVALCLLRIGQRCPRLTVDVLEGEGLGWSMDDVQ